MTKENFRQNAAIAAMQGFIISITGNTFLLEQHYKAAARENKDLPAHIARLAVDYADALSKQMEEKQ